MPRKITTAAAEYVLQALGVAASFAAGGELDATHARTGAIVPQVHAA